MIFKMFVKWNDECGISASAANDFTLKVERFFTDKNYGESVNTILIFLSALGYDEKPKHRYQKKNQKLNYDIILDYFLIKNVEMEKKKEIICNQVVGFSRDVINSHDFDDFDKSRFFDDLLDAVTYYGWE